MRWIIIFSYSYKEIGLAKRGKMKRLFLCYIVVLFQAHALCASMEEPHTPMTDFEKLSKEKEDLRQHTDELDKQREKLERQHEELEEQTYKQMSAMDAKEKELELLKQEQHKTNEHQQEINNLKQELDQYEASHEQLTDLEQEIDRLKTKMEEDSQRSVAITQQQDVIKNSTQALVHELDQQEDSIMQAQKRDDTSGAAHNFETISQLVSGVDFKETIKYIVEQMTSSFRDAVKMTLATINANISRAIEQTKALITGFQKDIPIFNTQMSALKQEIVKKNSEINTLSALKGFGGKGAYVNDLSILQEHVSAKDVLNNKSLNAEEFSAILEDGFDSITHDIRSALKFKMDTLEAQDAQGMLTTGHSEYEELQDVWNYGYSTAQEIINAYNQLPRPLHSVDVADFQSRIDVLDALEKAKRATLELANLQDELKVVTDQYQQELEKIKKLNQRNDELSGKKQANDVSILTIDYAQKRNKFIKEMLVLPDNLVKGGVTSLSSAEVNGLNQDLASFSEQVSALNPNDIVQDAKLGERREKMLNQQVNLLEHYLTSVEFFLEENQKQNIYGELVEQSFLLSPAGNEDARANNLVESKKKELGDAFISDKNDVRETLKKNGRSVVDLRKYGFNDNITIQKPTLALSDQALDSYIRDKVYDYAIHHIYDVLGLDETKAGSYTQEEIAQSAKSKVALKTSMVERAEVFKKNNPVQGAKVEKAALDLYEGPRQAYNSIGTLTGKKITDALRKSDEQVKKLITTVTEKKFNDSVDATAQLSMYINKADEVKNNLTSKIETYNKAINKLSMGK